MGWSKADLWCTPSAARMADEIADIDGVYCGPTVIVWIAAVWNINHRGRAYDYRGRAADKTLFPDGPRSFFGRPFGFQKSLDAILRRETQGELKLSGSVLHQYGSIHAELERRDKPIIICMYPDSITLHYVTLYKSQKKKRRLAMDKIQFYWQDNGLYGGENGGNDGLYKTAWRAVGLSEFVWGAHRVAEV